MQFNQTCVSLVQNQGWGQGVGQWQQAPPPGQGFYNPQQQYHQGFPPNQGGVGGGGFMTGQAGGHGGGFQAGGSGIPPGGTGHQHFTGFPQQQQQRQQQFEAMQRQQQQQQVSTVLPYICTCTYACTVHVYTPLFSNPTTNSPLYFICVSKSLFSVYMVCSAIVVSQSAHLDCERCTCTCSNVPLFVCINCFC